MILLRNATRRALRGGTCIFVLFFWLRVCFFAPAGAKAFFVSEHNKLLKEIHDEILAFGINEDPNLIEREFWMDLDGRDNNKEEHVVVMRHNDGLNLKMTVQVTYYSEDKAMRFVRFAIDTKIVQCCLKGDDLEIDKSDYSDKEMDRLFRDILAGIRNKKEILKLIKN
jgi:hypothetical protein